MLKVDKQRTTVVDPLLRIERRGPVLWTPSAGWTDNDGYEIAEEDINRLVAAGSVKVFVLRRAWWGGAMVQLCVRDWSKKT